VDDDVVAEHDLLAGAACDDEHEDSSVESFEKRCVSCSRAVKGRASGR
jgi:hypothetical protein